MYLLTFVTLLIGIIGIYTNVIALQTAQSALKATGIAPAMLVWHGAAISMAQSILQTNSAGFTAAIATTGCSLTFTLPAAASGIARCPPPYNLATGVPVNTAASGGGTVTDGASPPSPNLIYDTKNHYSSCVNLPSACSLPSPLPPGADCTACTANYDTTNYQFYSVLYGTGIQNYVITYVLPPKITAANPAPGFIAALPSGTLMGYTSGDLLRQLKNTSDANYAFGYLVDNGAGVTLKATGPADPLPASFSALSLNGGIALIGTP